jgi:hypothetical protein
MTATIIINGATLRADPAGALYWPERGLLVVADLHFEKASSFARRGQFLPPYDSRETLARLERLIGRFRPLRVVCLGDSFHDRSAALRLQSEDLVRLGRMIAAVDWVWIAGNHDPDPPAGLGGRVERELAEAPLMFRHEPAGKLLAAGEICGHFHPKATVATEAGRVSSRCFVTNGRALVMPAFGAFTGGLDATDPAISGLFARAAFRVLLLGDARLHLFSHRHLVRTARIERHQDAARVGP